MSYGDNLLSYLEYINSEFPMIDRGNFFAMLSTFLLLFATFLIVKCVCLRRRRITRILLFGVGFTTLWFSAFDITYIKKECGLCGVSYGYREIHAFGFLCYRGSYVTQEKETGFLISFPRKSGMCYHIYTTRSKIKNWGGILPTTEYYIGNIFTRLVDLENHPLPKSYPITSQMKIITQKDKDGNDYITVLSEFHENNRQKVLKSDLREQQSQQQPPETELQQENMETSEQTQEVESFGNLDNSKRESFGDPNDQPMGGGYGDFGESSQQITKNTETQFGERGAKLLFFSWHDLGKSLSLRVKKNYRQYQRGRY